METLCKAAHPPCPSCLDLSLWIWVCTGCQSLTQRTCRGAQPCLPPVQRPHALFPHQGPTWSLSNLFLRIFLSVLLSGSSPA